MLFRSFTVGEYIWIDGEVMLVTGVNNNTLTVLRGLNGSVPSSHGVNGGVFLAFNQQGTSRANYPNIGAV